MPTMHKMAKAFKQQYVPKTEEHYPKFKSVANLHAFTQVPLYLKDL